MNVILFISAGREFYFFYYLNFVVGVCCRKWFAVDSTPFAIIGLFTTIQYASHVFANRMLDNFSDVGEFSDKLMLSDETHFHFWLRQQTDHFSGTQERNQARYRWSRFLYFRQRVIKNFKKRLQHCMASRGGHLSDNIFHIPMSSGVFFKSIFHFPQHSVEEWSGSGAIEA